MLNWESTDVKFDAALSMVYGYNCFAELLPLALLSSVLAPWSLRCCSLVPVLRCISFPADVGDRNHPDLCCFSIADDDRRINLYISVSSQQIHGNH